MVGINLIKNKYLGIFTQAEIESSGLNLLIKDRIKKKKDYMRRVTASVAQLDAILVIVKEKSKLLSEFKL
jgi:hypothetical protein